ncbi:hypothetical protein [Vibrio sp. ED002]|nr:hypothetical protein [Vibrio sp. ED002]UQA50818.1 hypothetical protein ITG12_00205 [Vibrio sp. ED002]
MSGSFLIASKRLPSIVLIFSLGGVYKIYGKKEGEFREWMLKKRSIPNGK